MKYEKFKDDSSNSTTAVPGGVSEHHVMKNGSPDVDEYNERTELVGAEQGEHKTSYRNKILFGLLWLASLCTGLGFSIPAPFYPGEAASKNVSSTIVGLVFGCVQLANCITSPILGQFVPDIGPKLLCSSGIVVVGVTSILFGFLDKMNNRSVFVALSFILRILEGIGVAANTTASITIVCTQFEHCLSWAVATLQGAIGIGLMVGPTVGGVLYEFYGFGLPYWSVGALILLNGLLVQTFLPPVNDKIPERDRRSLLKLLRSPYVWVSMLPVFSALVGSMFLEPTLALHLSQFNLSAIETSLFFIIIPLMHACLSPLYGYIFDKKNVQDPIMLVSCITSAVGFLLLGPSPLIPFLPRALWTTILGLVVYGLFFSCAFMTSMNNFMHEARVIGLPDNISTFGVVAGLFNTVLYLGTFVGPTVGGALVDMIGFPYTTTAIAAMFLFNFLVFIAYLTYRWIKTCQQTLQEGDNE